MRDGVTESRAFVQRGRPRSTAIVEGHAGRVAQPKDDENPSSDPAPAGDPVDPQISRSTVSGPADKGFEASVLDDDSAPAPVPSVVAVVIAQDDAPHLEACIGALGASDYPDLTVLVIAATTRQMVSIPILRLFTGITVPPYLVMTTLWNVDG